ncbi:MAG: transcriptional repressor [Nitrospirae bacterium]|nr:transcriptional repressor [Nitrospirota bacterium]
MKTKFERILRSLNLKSTPKRIAMLEVLDDEQVYLSPEDIWLRLKKRFRTLGLPTVYRNLEGLFEGGVISRVIHPDRKLYYYLCRNEEHHHHFICMSCRRVEDVRFCAERELQEAVRSGIRGKVLSHILQINGLCHACLKKEGTVHVS